MKRKNGHRGNETAGRAAAQCRMAGCFFMALLICFTTFSAALADGTDEWTYGAGAQADAAVWAWLSAHDEAMEDGLSYVPTMLLAADGGTEAWLVTVADTAGAQDGTEAPPAGYRVMYIQLKPYPKVIGSFPAGEPLKKNKPACEIKLLLDAERLLDGDHLLAETFRERFATGDEYQTVSVMYLDTAARDYLAAGWINRIRLKEAKKKLTLTYKIRYTVDGDDLETALNAARADGFSLYDAQFPAEIDWGYSRMTLSFSADVDVRTDPDADPGLPASDAAVRMIAEHMPSEEKDWGVFGWGTGLAGDMQTVGPISFIRYSGAIGEQAVEIEIWPLPDGGGVRYIVEMSVECDSMDAAHELRDSVVKELDGMGILLHEDALKTSLILGPGL